MFLCPVFASIQSSTILEYDLHVFISCDLVFYTICVLHINYTLLVILCGYFTHILQIVILASEQFTPYLLILSQDLTIKNHNQIELERKEKKRKDTYCYGVPLTHIETQLKTVQKSTMNRSLNNV